MTDRPFAYEEGLLAECAQSPYASSLHDDTTGAAAVSKAARSACETLLKQHNTHYNRVLYSKSANANANANADDAAADLYEARLEQFTRHAKYVHQHNAKSRQQQQQHGHMVRMNQFSDMFPHELPLQASAIPPSLKILEEVEKQQEGLGLFPLQGSRRSSGGDRSVMTKLVDMDDVLKVLQAWDEDDNIDKKNNIDVDLNVLDLYLNKHHHHHHHKHHTHHKTDLPASSTDTSAETPETDTDVSASADETPAANANVNDTSVDADPASGTLVDDANVITSAPTTTTTTKPPHKHHKDKDKDKDKDKKHKKHKDHKHNHQHPQSSSKDQTINSFTYSSSSYSASLHDSLSQQDDDDPEHDLDNHADAGNGGVDVDEAFGTYLNWATTENPDGVPIVHAPQDQGGCGSCWAFAAIGTLEASISRGAAFDAFATTLRRLLHSSTSSSSSSNNPNSNNPTSMQDMEQQATQASLQAEYAAMRIAQLSVQELVDCDVYGDQGCSGGNPLLALYFLHTYGLTTATAYPYQATQGSCRYDLVRHPVATVQSWGVLTPSFEKNMEVVLRYVGPIAVGMNGADVGFLSYAGGIFESEGCEEGEANHAMLIVGYGEEKEESDGTVRKYWIARNSWGQGWGEKGYVRMARSSTGERGYPGVCGIAQNPSVALGGKLLVPLDADIYVDGANNNNNNGNNKKKMEDGVGGDTNGPSNAAGEEGGGEVVKTKKERGRKQLGGIVGNLRLSCAGMGFDDHSFCVRVGGVHFALGAIVVLMSVTMFVLLVARRLLRGQEGSPRRRLQPITGEDDHDDDEGDALLWAKDADKQEEEDEEETEILYPNEHCRLVSRSVSVYGIMDGSSTTTTRESDRQKGDGGGGEGQLWHATMD